MKKLLKIFLGLLLLAFLVLLGTGAYLAYLWSSNLPYIGALRHYEPPVISYVYSEEGEVIATFADEKRIVAPLDRMPPYLIQGFIAAEDSRFYQHEGVDLKSISRAFLKNLRAGRIAQGGSTITQQVTKSLLLKDTGRTYRRKVREAILSVQVEKEFSKEEILFLYLNQIYLGHGAYGVAAAAEIYFGVPVEDLTLGQAAMLAGLPQAPARYSPAAHFDLARMRQKYVLERMVEEGYITAGRKAEALEAPLNLKTVAEQPYTRAPYFTETVRQQLLERYGRDFLYRAGLKVYTTVDLRMQEAARQALLKGLDELDKREGYRGPMDHLADDAAITAYKVAAAAEDGDGVTPGTICAGLVEAVDDQAAQVTVWLRGQNGILPLAGMQWARKVNPDRPYYAAKVRAPSEALRKGDLIQVRVESRDEARQAWMLSLAQAPLVQGAVVCLDPFTGAVRALVGGQDFFASQFNRATQARRQPGSAFKPVIYAAALDKGLSPADMILDAPYIGVQDEDEEVWKPKNYSQKFFGPTLVRTALAKSRNVITVKILEQIGVSYAIAYARRLGIESELSPDLSLALGSSGVSLIELVRAYAVFANGGNLPQPVYVKRVVDRHDRVIEENAPEAQPAISSQTAFVMTDLLKAVIQEGTAWRVKALKRPAAGKTGTTNNLWDAWFMGYTPELVAGVWVGYDDYRPMGKGETGSRAASPIWLDFMEQALKDLPVQDFKVPEGIVFAKIDVETGKLAGPRSEKHVYQAFEAGKEPRDYAPASDRTPSLPFFQLDMNDAR